MAQEKLPPTAICVTPARSEESEDEVRTFTGLLEDVVVPLPSAPKKLSPQQRAVPSLNRAHKVSVDRTETLRGGAHQNDAGVPHPSRRANGLPNR